MGREYQPDFDDDNGFARDTQNFYDEASALILRLDEDEDGFLSPQETGNAVQDDSINGRDAQITAALHINQKVLEELFDDESGDENNGVTLEDLNVFQDRVTDYRQESYMRQSALFWSERESNFENVDSNENGYLSLSEINAARINAEPGSLERAVLSFMTRRIHTLEESNDDEWLDENDGITKVDLRKALEEYAYGSADHKLIDSINKPINRIHNVQEANHPRVLFAKKESAKQPLFLDGPEGLLNCPVSETENVLPSIHPDAIHQGMIGNCDFMATLASLAWSSPESIRDMISENGNGTFTVTFKGAPDEPITVDPPSEIELGIYNTSSEYGIWASVIEKAYGKYRQESLWRRSYLNLGGGHTPAEGGDGGGLIGSSMELLTGNSTDVDDIQFTRHDTTVRKLTEAFASESPLTVVAGTASGVYGIKGQSPDGFTTSHLYSVIAFDQAGADGGTITVRNPWGFETSSISLKKFEKNFQKICYERQ